MQLADYQHKARNLDGRSADAAAHQYHLNGLTGTVGDLARADNTHTSSGWAKMRTRDILAEAMLHLSGLADAHGLTLKDIAVAGLTTQAYRAIPSPPGDFFDAICPAHEQLPRHISYEFTSTPREDGTLCTRIHRDDRAVGDPLTDCNASNDAYRLHDVFHLAYATHLGWSPVTRALLKCKRRSDPRTDENEDGGRAVAIEEAASALAFSRAADYDYFLGYDRVDPHLLDTLVLLTSPLEVGARRPADWQRAILDGFAMWHRLCEHNGHGTVHADLLARAMTFQPSSALGLSVARAG